MAWIFPRCCQRAALACCFAQIVFCLILPSLGFAQDGKPASAAIAGGLPQEDIGTSLEQIGQAIVDLQALVELDEATKTAALQLYQTAQKRLESAKAAVERIGDYERRIQAAPEQIKLFTEQQIKLSQARPVEVKDVNVDQLKQQLIQQQGLLEQAKKEVADLTSEPSRRLQRIGEFPNLIADKNAELAVIEKQLQTENPPSESPVLTRARLSQQKAQKTLLEKELNELAVEQKAYQATEDLVPLQLSVASLRQGELQREVDELQKAISRRQSDEVKRALDQAQSDLDRAPAPLHPWAKRNLELAKMRQLYVEQNIALVAKLETVRSKTEDLSKQFKTLVDRVNAVGLTEAMGLMIRQQRQELLKLKSENSTSPSRENEIRNIQVNSFDLKDEFASLANDREQIQELGRMLDASTEGERSRQLEIATSMVSQRRMLLPVVATANDNLFRTMFLLDTEQKILSKKIDELIDYIDQRAVWIPSCQPLSKNDLLPLADAVKWLLASGGWKDVVTAIGLELRQNPLRYLPSILGTLLLFLLHPRFKKILQEAGDQAKKGRCCEMTPTWNAILATALLSAGWPVLGMLFGWLLSNSPGKLEFVHAVGIAILQVSLFFIPLETLRNVCRRDGLAEGHFDWPDRLRKFIRINLRWYNFVSLPSLFVVLLLDNQPVDEWKYSLGRLAAIILFAAVILFMHRLWRPEGVFFQHLSLRNSQTAFYRFRGIWYLFMVGLPTFLLVLVIAGYYYTAIVLGACLVRTAGAVVFQVLIGGVALRYVLVRRRRQAIEESRKARLAMAAATSGATNAPVESVPIAVPEQPVLDLASVNRQAREIVFFLISAAGAIWLYWIWRDVLPAIGMLDNTELWSSTIGERVEKVTLKSLLFAGLCFAITILMIKNMPGLLNLLAQQYSSLDSGTRYAATTIFRYLITVIGVVTALSFLKIPWSQYSWLIAAVSVGLGFGLQEIVANFVSGLILLLERPVRVGDLVTIAETTGVVTRIQMRATTVTNWDHQELIVPNKELITGKLLNWTLSNLVNRLVLKVGVAYGSDTAQVYRILMQVVTRHPDVLADPPPIVNFDEFGESSLDFMIRCFLPNVEKRIQVKHELNMAIEKALRKANIGIPFPQRDVHIIERRQE